MPRPEAYNRGLTQEQRDQLKAERDARKAARVAERDAMLDARATHVSPKAGKPLVGAEAARQRKFLREQERANQ